MISYIRGPLEEKREDSVVVEAGNIGYRIFIPSSVLGELPGLGEEVKIYTYFSVREDGMSLYGFLSKQDLEMFHPGKQDVLRFYLVLEVKNDPLGRLCSDTGCL